jgi:hypothetical protein
VGLSQFRPEDQFVLSVPLFEGYFVLIGQHLFSKIT